jgi:phosphomannomutase
MDIPPNVFKAYDIRGLVDSELNSDFAFETGVAFARFLQIEREPATVVIGEELKLFQPVSLLKVWM